MCVYYYHYHYCLGGPGQLDVLADPLAVRLQALVLLVGEAQVLLVHEAAEEEDRLQKRQRVLEFVDLVAVDEDPGALQEELVVSHLLLVREAEAAAQVREVELGRASNNDIINVNTTTTNNNNNNDNDNHNHNHNHNHNTNNNKHTQITDNKVREVELRRACALV